MDKKQRTRYLVAVYTIVASLGVILLLLAFNRSADTWQVTLINISTELFGAVAVFFLVNYFFLADEWNVSEKIDGLISKLDLMLDRPSAKDFFQAEAKIESHVHGALKIDICGVVLTSLINKQFSNLRDRLEAGAIVRVLVIDPSSLALSMSAARSELNDVDYYRKRIEATIKDLGALHRSLIGHSEKGRKLISDGKFQVRLLQYAPSFGILGLNADQSYGKVFIEIYPHHIGYGSPPIFSLTPSKDGDWYKYFVDQFEAMWRASVPWQADEAMQSTSSAHIAFQGRIRPEDFFLPQNYMSNDTFASAKTIHLLGYSLARTMRDYFSILSQKLAEGASLKVIIVDPEIDTLMQEISLESISATSEEWRNSLQKTISILKALAKTSSGKGEVELGYLPYTPSVGLKMIDPYTPEGHCFVEIYHHKTAAHNPTFLLSAKNGMWYEHFRRQYELLWSSCRVERMNDSNNT